MNQYEVTIRDYCDYTFRVQAPNGVEARRFAQIDFDEGAFWRAKPGGPEVINIMRYDE